jgi:hypothetical protein
LQPSELETIRVCLPQVPSVPLEMARALELAAIAGITDSAVELARDLLQMQLEDGSWGVGKVNRIRATAAVVHSLIQSKGWITIENPKSPLERAVLQAVSYLLKVGPGQRMSQPAAGLALALSAIHRYTSDIELPVEELAASLNLTRERLDSFSVLEAAKTAISVLHAERNAIRESLAKLASEHKRVRYFRVVAIAMTTLLLLISALSFSILSYALLNGTMLPADLTSAANGVLRIWILPYWGIIASLAGLWIVLALSRVGLLPKTVLKVVRAIAGMFGLQINRESDAS